MSKLLLFFCFLCSTFLLVRNECEDLDKYFYIQSKGNSSFYLDATNVVNVTIQLLTSSEDQQWKLIPSKSIGLFNIVSRRTEKVLDVIPDANVGHDIAILNSLYDSPSQQWYINQEGTIINKEYADQAVDIQDEIYEVGNQIIVYKRQSDLNQRFRLVY